VLSISADSTARFGHRGPAVFPAGPCILRPIVHFAAANWRLYLPVWSFLSARGEFIDQ